MKTKNLKQAFEDIKNGKTIQPKGTRGKIWVYFGYIYWENYGQSANNININELRWIFKTIFNSKNYEYTVI